MGLALDTMEGTIKYWLLIFLFKLSHSADETTTEEFWPGKDCPVDPKIGLDDPNNVFLLQAGRGVLHQEPEARVLRRHAHRHDDPGPDRALGPPGRYNHCARPVRLVLSV